MRAKLAQLLSLIIVCLSLVAISPVSYGSFVFDRKKQTAELPTWLYIAASHRTRYESLSTQFRSKGKGGDQQLAMRTLFAVGVKSSEFNLVLEAGDSRAILDDDGSPLSTNMINPIELIQGYLVWKHQGLFKKGDRSSLRIGRLTLDMGSRRLVARSKFRNTMNTFSGVEWTHVNRRGNELQFFYTMPTNRKPKSFSDLKNNHINFDMPTGRTHFWGVSYTNINLLKSHEVNFYGTGLHEKDSKEIATYDRNLITAGFRTNTSKKEIGLDYLIESIYQFGESRNSKKSTDNTDLEHFAHFHHVEAGYSWKPYYSYRIAVEYDYASGDSSSSDNHNGRFHSLYGARRFDFGPTGIYGPFKRENLNSVGLRITMKPSNATEFMSSYRGFWRASKSDGWVASGISDVTNIAPRFLGQQVEVRLRWKAVPQTLHLELGSAYLRSGKFAKVTEPLNYKKNIYYGYAQVSYMY